MTNKLILTPYGYAEEDKIIKIDNSMCAEALSDGRLLIKDKDSGQLLEEFPKTLEASNIMLEPNNYMGYTLDDNTVKNIKSFKTTWAVPQYPAERNSKKTFFLWNGLNGGALQPVLVWGNGRACYRLQNWAFINNKYICGDEIEVKPGDEITGVISLLKAENEKWFYVVSFQYHSHIDLFVTRDSEATGVILCYESYTKEFNQIPSSKYCKMKDICLEMATEHPKPIYLDWHVRGDPIHTPSGNNTVIVNSSATNGEIDFYFH